MAILVNGKRVAGLGAPGPAGKSAYQSAVDAGYSGSEEEFNALFLQMELHLQDTENPHGVTAEDVGADAAGAAAQALSEANKYTDDQLANIPTPDVSGQIGNHNTATDAHADIRQAVAGAQSAADAAQQTADGKLSSVFHVGTEAPANTALLWIDTANGLKYHNGSSWVVVPVSYS